MTLVTTITYDDKRLPKKRRNRIRTVPSSSQRVTRQKQCSKS